MEKLPIFPRSAGELTENCSIRVVSISIPTDVREVARGTRLVAVTGVPGDDDVHVAEKVGANHVHLARAPLLRRSAVETNALVPHRHWTFPIPRALRGIVERDRKLLGLLSRTAYAAILNTGCGRTSWMGGLDPGRATVPLIFIRPRPGSRGRIRSARRANHRRR
jgi:hypothetical protein